MDFRPPNGDIGTFLGDISRTAVAIYAIESGLKINSFQLGYYFLFYATDSIVLVDLFDFAVS